MWPGIARRIGSRCSPDCCTGSVCVTGQLWPAGSGQHHGVCRTCETSGLFLSRVASWSLAATEWVSPPLSLPRCMLLRSSDSCPTTEPCPLLVLSGEKYLLAPPTPALPATDGGPDTGSGTVEAGRHGCCVQSPGVCGAGRACIMTMDWHTAGPCMAQVGQQQTSAHDQEEKRLGHDHSCYTVCIACACCAVRGFQLWNHMDCCPSVLAWQGTCARGCLLLVTLSM